VSKILSQWEEPAPIHVKYLDAGFDHVYVHEIGKQQLAFINFFRESFTALRLTRMRNHIPRRCRPERSGEPPNAVGGPKHHVPKGKTLCRPFEKGF
jgi:hypothetical protein